MMTTQEKIGYQEITHNFIFDVKLGYNLRCEARLVGYGHKTKPSFSIKYSSIVSRYSVEICLLIEALGLWLARIILTYEDNRNL